MQVYLSENIPQSTFTTLLITYNSYGMHASKKMIPPVLAQLKLVFIYNAIQVTEATLYNY